MDWKDWSDKKIFVVLNSRQKYTGVVIEVEYVGDINGINTYLISIIDKFNKHVSFSTNEITEIKEM